MTEFKNPRKINQVRHRNQRFADEIKKRRYQYLRFLSPHRMTNRSELTRHHDKYRAFLIAALNAASKLPG